MIKGTFPQNIERDNVSHGILCNTKEEALSVLDVLRTIGYDEWYIEGKEKMITDRKNFDGIFLYTHPYDNSTGYNDNSAAGIYYNNENNIPIISAREFLQFHSVLCDVIIDSYPIC